VLGTAKLLTFAFRALVLLLLISILWANVADTYNEAVVKLAGPFFPTDTTIIVLGALLRFNDPQLGTPITIDALTLHFGLILMIVLVLSVVGLGIVARLVWLAILTTGAFLVHVIGVAMLARGLVWASNASSPESSGDLVFSLFAVFWGLIPPAVGGVWCLMYWLPKVRQQQLEQQQKPSESELASATTNSSENPPENS